VKDKKATYRQILIVIIVLAVLTAIEFTVALSLDNATVSLFIIAVVKAGLVVQFFMHIYRLWRGEEHS
jgi:caa(3)-type oxidase subunit IV